MGTLDTMIDLGFLKDKDACEEGIKYFKTQIAEPIAARELIEKLLAADDGGKIWWVNWLICRLFTHEQAIACAIFEAEQVLAIFEQEYPDDKRPRAAIEAAKQVALSDTEENKKIAARAADAARAAWAETKATAEAAANAAYVAYAAANAAYSAADATYAAAYAADAAAYAAYAAADATYAAANMAAANMAAANAADEAAYAVAYAAVATAKKEMLLKIINYGIVLLENK